MSERAVVKVRKVAGSVVISIPKSVQKCAGFNLGDRLMIEGQTGRLAAKMFQKFQKRSDRSDRRYEQRKSQ